MLHSWRNPWLIIALLALGLVVWQWVETRVRLADTQQLVARRLSDSDTVARDSLTLSRQAQDQLAALQGKLGELEGRLAESKDQHAALESLYQTMTRNHDELALAEIEQGIVLAAQQLQLAANVQGAVLALQTAETRLAGDNGRPQFIGLRKALVRDLDRLRALPQIDLPGMSVHLESVIAAVASLPLAADGRPREDGSAKPAPAATKEAAKEAPAGTVSVTSLLFWQRTATDFWNEIRGLVRIQRFDRDEPALLAPTQIFFLRENLKLRLLSARLALLAHDEVTFRNELKQAQVWIERYFDPREKSVQTVRDALQQLVAAEISIDLPNLNESLTAIKNFKLAKERK